MKVLFHFVIIFNHPFFILLDLNFLLLIFLFYLLKPYFLNLKVFNHFLTFHYQFSVFLTVLFHIIIIFNLPFFILLELNCLLLIYLFYLLKPYFMSLKVYYHFLIFESMANIIYTLNEFLSEADIFQIHLSNCI